MATHIIDTLSSSTNPVNRYSNGRTKTIKIPATKLIDRYVVGSKIVSSQDTDTLSSIGVEPVSPYDYYYLNQNNISFNNDYIDKNNLAGLIIKYGVRKSRIAFPFKN